MIHLWSAFCEKISLKRGIVSFQHQKKGERRHKLYQGAKKTPFLKHSSLVEVAMLLFKHLWQPKLLEKQAHQCQDEGLPQL